MSEAVTSKALLLLRTLVIVVLPGGALIGGGLWALERKRKYGRFLPTREELEGIKVDPSELPGGAGAASHEVTGYRHGNAFRMRIVAVAPGHWASAETAVAFGKMRQAAELDDVRLVVVSAWRTHAKQTELHRAWQEQKRLFAEGKIPVVRPPVVAVPGTSNHQNGVALDIQVGESRDSEEFKWLQRNAARFGFANTVNSEPWHWEFQG